MSKFEVGDKVRVTAAYSAVGSAIRQGDEFVVTAVEREQPYPIAASGFVFNEDELELIADECLACDCTFPQVFAEQLITVDFGEQGLIVLHEDEAQALIRELELVTG